jgi:hypothetical protein
MKYIIVLLFVAGCAPLVPAAVPVEVKEPVAVSCNAHPPQRPQWNLPQLTPAATDADKLRAALQDLELSKAYIIELEAALAACG